MLIKKIEVNNFKSFRNLNIEPGNFNILIGTNASGKSNFCKVFEFLKDIAVSGLENAVSLQGGSEYLRNIMLKDSSEFSARITFETGNYPLYEQIKNKSASIRHNESIYEFKLNFKENCYEVIQDRLIHNIEFIELETPENKSEAKKIIGQGRIILNKEKEQIKTEFEKPEDISIDKSDVIPEFLINMLSNKALLLESPFIYPPLSGFGEFFIYDFDPRLPKKASPITGKADLERDGSNLSIVLKNIMANEEKMRKYKNLIKDILPFVSDLDVKKYADKSLLFSLQEIYSRDYFLPASFISDGTINIIALIIALYFENKDFTIIEEPDRNIHPHLMSKVVSMLKDASEKKQIVVTTHNPEILKHCDLKDIFLVSRDKDGFSNISKPSEKEEIKIFLENDMAIEELYIQNLLEL